jgi:flagellum-specific peptidoglycan hydrolase FlgJ
LAREAFEAVVHAAPTANELRILLAVALHETTFGSGWRAEGIGSNNMGALQADSSWTGETFSYSDSHPTSTGTSTQYQANFRKYPTALDGWKDLVRVLYMQSPATRQAARAGDARAVARAMKRAGYYEGQGATVEQRIGSYEQALVNALWEIDHFSGVK